MLDNLTINLCANTEYLNVKMPSVYISRDISYMCVQSVKPCDVKAFLSLLSCSNIIYNIIVLHQFYKKKIRTKNLYIIFIILYIVCITLAQLAHTMLSYTTRMWLFLYNVLQGCFCFSYGARFKNNTTILGSCSYRCFIEKCSIYYWIIIHNTSKNYLLFMITDRLYICGYIYLLFIQGDVLYRILSAYIVFLYLF